MGREHAIEGLPGHCSPWLHKIASTFFLFPLEPPSLPAENGARLNEMADILDLTCAGGGGGRIVSYRRNGGDRSLVGRTGSMRLEELRGFASRRIPLKKKNHRLIDSECVEWMLGMFCYVWEGGGGWIGFFGGFFNVLGSGI